MKASVASSCIHIDAAAVPEPAARQNLAAGVSTTIEPESLLGPKIPCGSGGSAREGQRRSEKEGEGGRRREIAPAGRAA